MGLITDIQGSNTGKGKTGRSPSFIMETKRPTAAPEVGHWTDI